MNKLVWYYILTNSDNGGGYGGSEGLMIGGCICLIVVSIGVIVVAICSKYK